MAYTESMTNRPMNVSCLKWKALIAFRDHCLKSHSMDDVAKHFKALDIRNKITENNAFNPECHRDLNARGNSNAFWEAVIKWCPTSPEAENILLAEQWEREIDEIEDSIDDSEDLQELNEIQDTLNEIDAYEQQEREAIQTEHLADDTALNWDYELNIAAVLAVTPPLPTGESDIRDKERNCENCKYFDDEDGCYMPNNHPKVTEVVSYLNEYERRYSIPYNPALACPGYEYFNHCYSDQNIDDGWEMLQDFLSEPLTDREHKIVDDHYALMGKLASSEVDDFVTEDKTCAECGGCGTQDLFFSQMNNKLISTNCKHCNGVGEI